MGVGAGEAGNVENAHIHRREGQHGFLALGGGHFHFHLEGRFGEHLFRCIQAHRQLALAAFQRQMDQAEGPRRGDFFTGAAGAQHHHRHVKIVAAPFLVERDVHGGGAIGHGHALAPQGPVAFDADQGLAAVGRADGEFCRVTVLVGRLVELEGDPVGANALVFVVAGAPAGVETVFEGLAGFRVTDFQAIAAVFDRHLQLAAATGGKGDAAGGDQLFGFGEAGMPATLVVETPVVVAVFAEQAGRQRGGLEGAVAVGTDHFKRGLAAFPGVITQEQRTHANQHRRRPIDAFDRADHRAAAAFQQAEGGAHGEGRLAFGNRCQVDVETALAGIVEAAFVQFDAASGAVFVGIAELEAGELLGQRVLLAFVLDDAEQAVAGSRGAVEVAALHGQFKRLFRVEAGVGRVEFELHALGQEFLDAEAIGVGGQLVGRVGAQFEYPGAGRGVSG